MSQQITEAFVQQYTANVTMLYQQQGSLLRGTVREDTVVGKNYFFDRVGPTAAVKRTVRHGDTPLVNSPHSRRMVNMTDYEWADLVDDQDKIRLLISPESAYAKNAAMALGRAFDDAIIAAFEADAKAGEDGATVVTFASEAAADLDFTAAALTTANILTIKRKHDDKDVPKSNRTILIPPAALEQLLKQTSTPNATSADYASVKALVRGELDTWVGYKWIMLTRLPKVAATNVTTCFAFHEDSMGIALGKDIMGRVDVLPGKSYSTQVYAAMTMGATRVQGEGVIRFKIDEDL